MNDIATELNTVCAELRSEKVASRHKAAEKLDTLLCNSKNALISVLANAYLDGQSTWQMLFHASIHAVFKQAAKIEETLDEKQAQTLRNKNYIYSGIVSKIIEYNLEVRRHFLKKTDIYNVFTQGFSTGSAIRNFGDLFLTLLERGIYKSEIYVRELKLNEFCLILSYLFEFNVRDNEQLQFAILGSIIKTIEKAIECSQVDADLINYLPELQCYVQKVGNHDKRKADVLKLFHIFVTQLAVDCHHEICQEIQRQLPALSNFYSKTLKPDIKELLFNCIYTSLYVMYPHIYEGNFSSFNVPIEENWKKTIKRLVHVINTEIKERQFRLYRETDPAAEKCMQRFINMSSLLLYLQNWHLAEDVDDEVDEEQACYSRSKKSKPTDKLELLMGFLQTPQGDIQDLWLAIVSKILCNHAAQVLNTSNYLSVLQTMLQLLQKQTNLMNLENIRQSLQTLLQEETVLIDKQMLNAECSATLWCKCIDFMLSELSTRPEIINEKQLLIQALIKHGKFNCKQSQVLLTSIMSNNIMKLTQCIETVRQLLLHIDLCGLSKTEQLICDVIVWLNDASSSKRPNAKSILLNIKPVEADLLADTSAIAVTNFLKPLQPVKKPEYSAHRQRLQLLLYKHNKKFVCLEEHGAERQLTEQENSYCAENCLFQQNYELLMRTLQVDTSNDNRDILLDLKQFYALSCLLQSLLKYRVFAVADFGHGALIKRIGFFFSQLEFQLKDKQPQEYESADLSELLQRLQAVFIIYTSHELLLDYLEKQPLDELIAFLGKTLKLKKIKAIAVELEDLQETQQIRANAMRTLALLCASTTHINEAFEHIAQVQLKVNNSTDLQLLLNLIELFCAQKTHSTAVSAWFAELLKAVFQNYYKHIPIVEQLLDMLPALFAYVQHFEDELHVMLIALKSYMKLAQQKSYSVQLTAKLLRTVRLIARNCCHGFSLANLNSLYVNVVGFLKIPSLEVQYAVINTLAALFDIHWFKGTAVQEESKMHFDFCQLLMTKIVWPQLENSSTDLLENMRSVTVQLLVAMLIFSNFYQCHSLKHFLQFVTEQKLTETDLYELRHIGAFYNCSLKALTQPYVEDLVHTWLEQQHEILKFPYFICCESLDEFIKDNLSIIATGILIYGKAQHLGRLAKYATDTQLVKLALPTCLALSLLSQVECVEAQDAAYQSHMKNLKRNLQAFGRDLQNVQEQKGIKIADLLFNGIKLLSNVNDVDEDLNGFNHCQKCWYNISLESLNQALQFYGHNVFAMPEQQDIFGIFITKSPQSLVNCLGALKEQYERCLLPYEQLKYLQLYWFVAERILKAAADNMERIQTLPTVANFVKFYLRDMLFFFKQAFERSQQFDVLLQALKLMQQIFQQPLLRTTCGSVVIKQYLGAIVKSLLHNLQQSNALTIIKQQVQQLLEAVAQLLQAEPELYTDALHFIEELPSQENLNEVRAMFSAISVEAGEELTSSESTLSSVVAKLLTKKTCSLEQLRHSRLIVAKNKKELQQDAYLLYELVQHLIKIVRCCDNKEMELEASKFLGEIGALQIKNASFYFDNDAGKKHNSEKPQTPMQHFTQCLLETLDELLLSCTANLQRLAVEVAKHVVNSKSGQKLRKQGITPFLDVFLANANFVSCLDNQQLIGTINWLQILKSTENLGYNAWNSAFVAKIFESCNWSCFQQLAAANYNFAEATLEVLITFLLENKAEHLAAVLVMLDYFFEQCSLFIDQNQMDKSIYREKRLIIKFLHICESIRVQNNWRLPLKLQHVIKACNYCQAYFISILYLELWALEDKNIDKEKRSKENLLLKNSSFQLSAREAFQAICCTDALNVLIDPMAARLDFLNLNNDWSELLLEANLNDLNASRFYAQMLKRNGMLSLANKTQDSSNLDYEICWRLCQWETPVHGHAQVDTLNDLQLEFEKHHFNTLKCLYNREEKNALAALSNARDCVLHILKEISVECLQSVYKFMNWLQFLQHAEDFCQVQFATGVTPAHIFEKWQMEWQLQYGNFQFKEQVLTHQITLFKTAGVRASRKINEFYKENPIESCLLKLISECKMAGQINLAKQNLVTLRNMQSNNSKTKALLLLEDADVCLKTQQTQLCRAILQNILKTEDLAFYLPQISARLMYGEYMMETNTNDFKTVLKKCFLFAMEYLEKIKQQLLPKQPSFCDALEFERFELKSKKKAHEIIAKYADREYTQLYNYINSDEFQTKCQIIKSNREAADMVDKKTKERSKIISANFMRKFANLDEKEEETVRQTYTDNLCIAVEHYLKYCIFDDCIQSAAIYRILSLWYANKSNEQLHGILAANLQDVPSYKFIGALNQITARLNSKNSAFVEILKSTLVRCAQDHPHQTLPQLYALMYAYSDDKSPEAQAANKDKHGRTAIAKQIVTKATSAQNLACITQLNNLFPALIEYANLTVTDQKSPFTLSKELRRLKNLDAVQCLTIELPIAIDKQYQIISVIKWNEQVQLCGGINMPKKLTCLCSNGSTHIQLLKGRDDLRQDAVMQQVFGMINNLLKSEQEANERKLSLRTYKVVPLTMQCGVLEWCQNTVPIGLYLCGNDKNGGAHQKYRPSDFTVNQCRKLAMAQLKSDFKKRHTIFTHICEHIQPVLHYFFFEKYQVPGVWFERRLAYTNSVATTSIVGYVLGIGDRHTQNILIDEITAEVVHIDFGIAFEQGKVMPTPETVPFRLTRDIIAPMGVAETNGIFQKSCEATMSILRKHSAVIKTILEVLLYDPLYLWSVVKSNAVAATAASDEQNNESENEIKNMPAQRALLCVQNKLNGIQDGIVGSSNVDVQVQRLINDATSSHNLALLYPGWDPYL